MASEIGWPDVGGKELVEQTFSDACTDSHVSFGLSCMYVGV